MAEQSLPVLRASQEVSLIGTITIYDSQAQASQRIPLQWQALLRHNPALAGSPRLYGASPCTGDGKIHYLAGVALEDPDDAIEGERLTLAAGEYAVVRVDEAALLRDTWIWLLRSWLPASGRREKNAPEFERYSGISDDGTPVCPVEIWIPLERLPSI